LAKFGALEKSLNAEVSKVRDKDLVIDSLKGKEAVLETKLTEANSRVQKAEQAHAD